MLLTCSATRPPGWPTTDELPDKFLVRWAVVNEPDKKRKTEGAIYIWVTYLSEKTETISESGWKDYLIPFSVTHKSNLRVHQSPYSTEDHKAITRVMGRIINKEKVVGTRKRGDAGGSRGKGKNGKSSKGKDGGTSGGSFSLSDDINFQNLPPTVLPDKK